MSLTNAESEPKGDGAYQALLSSLTEEQRATLHETMRQEQERAVENAAHDAEVSRKAVGFIVRRALAKIPSDKPSKTAVKATCQEILDNNIWLFFRSEETKAFTAALVHAVQSVKGNKGSVTKETLAALSIIRRMIGIVEGEDRAGAPVKKAKRPSKAKLDARDLRILPGPYPHRELRLGEPGKPWGWEETEASKERNKTEA